VTKGRARCIIITTGIPTELGKIATALGTQQKSTAQGWKVRKEKLSIALGVAGATPRALQIKLNKMAYMLLDLAVVLAVISVYSTGYKIIPNSIAIYAMAAAISLLPASSGRGGEPDPRSCLPRPRKAQGARETHGCRRDFVSITSDGFESRNMY
jgi:P-type Na+/K+ transporter